MPVIGAAAPYPVAVDPDIAFARSDWTGIHYIGGFVGHVSIHGAAGHCQTTTYYN